MIGIKELMAIKIKPFSPSDLTPDMLKRLSVEESDALFRQWQHQRAMAGPRMGKAPKA